MNELRNENENKSKGYRPTPLGVFAVMLVIAAIAATVILILHNSYGLLQF